MHVKCMMGLLQADMKSEGDIGHCLYRYLKIHLVDNDLQVKGLIKPLDYLSLDLKLNELEIYLALILLLCREQTRGAL